MIPDALCEILLGLGVPADQIGPDTRLRADLQLDSTETTELELQLRQRLGVELDLWDATDYTVSDLVRAIRAEPAR